MAKSNAQPTSCTPSQGRDGVDNAARSVESAADTVARLQLALAAARLGDWSWDAASDMVNFSARAAEIFGIEAGPQMTWTAMRELLHADDRELARHAVEQSLVTRTDYVCEYRVRSLAGGWTWVAANGRGQHAADGDVTGMIGVVQDITARKLSEAAMRREIEERHSAEQRLSFALKAARMGDWTWDVAQNTMRLTDRAAEIVGVAQGSKITREDMRALIHPEDLKRTQQITLAAIENHTEYTVEHRLLQRSGDYIWVSVDGHGIYDAEGKLTALTGIIQEIESRKAEEERARAREAQLHFISSNAPTLLSHVNREGRFLFVNKAFADRWKKDPGEFVGKTVAEVAGPAAAASVEQYIQRVLNGETVELEMEVDYRDLGRRYMRATYAPEFAPDGKVCGWLSAATDITERWKAEQALRESEARLRLATRSGKVGLWEWDIPGNGLTWTDSLYDIYGVKRDQFPATAENFRGLVHPDDRGPVQRAIQSSIEHDVPYELEFRAVRPGGAVVWLFTNAIVIREEGKPKWMLGATFDITARKQAEIALRESEVRFRALTKLAPVGIFLADTNGDSLFVNDKCRELTGLTTEELRGRQWTAALHPDDRQRVETEWVAAVKECRSFNAEYRFIHLDKSIRWVQGSAVEHRNSTGALLGYVGTLVDITQRKVAEEALRESEKRFRTLASHAPVGIFLTDPQGETIFVNESWSAMTGLDLEKAKGGGWVEAMHPDDRARVAAGWVEAVAQNRASTAEYRFVRADGTIIWVQGNAVQLRDNAGRMVGYIGTVADFTQRKATEERLRAREAELRLITTNAPIILAHCDRESRFLFVNRAYAERFGLEINQVVGRTLQDVVGEKAYAALRPNIERVLGGEAITFEIELPYAGIGSRFMRVAYTPDFAEDGGVRGYLAAISDLSDRRAMENALRESEARFRQLADSMPQIVFTADAAGHIDYYNLRWYELTGAAKGVAGDESFLPILHPDDRQRCLDTWYASVRSGEVYQIEYRLCVNSTAEYRWYLGRALPVRDESGKIVRWYGTCTDIHDGKLVQDELSRRSRSLETLNRVGGQLAAERDLEKVVQSVTDAGRELSGAAFGAFFYNLTNEAGESYTLYTISGVPREAFDKFPMPRATKLFGPTFRGEGAVRIGDVLRDERYGKNPPHHGMPAGHLPVRSYLAVPVISRSGQVLGGLFFGHPEPDRFSADAERTVLNLAAQAAIAIDNANLYRALEHELRQKTAAEEELRNAQQQLQAHANDLEQRVEQRTASLREAILQMEEFSYSVSHDLRAPLRAMNAYAQALLEDYGAQLDDTARSYLDRIQRSSTRMEKLTHDVLRYSRIARAEIQLEELDTEVLVRDVVLQYRELQAPAAEVEIRSPLLRVRGHESSLGQAIANLLTNAVKFMEPGVKPHLRIRTELLGERVRVWIEDNGIGIAPEYQERLFRVFERVPTRHTYDGTGIGLAIVRKTLEKMGGACGVVSDGRTGSHFWIELPKA